MNSKIKIDIDELILRLEQMKDDGYVTVELEVCETDFFYDAGELLLAVVDVMEEETLSYGSIAGINYFDE